MLILYSLLYQEMNFFLLFDLIAQKKWEHALQRAIYSTESRLIFFTKLVKIIVSKSLFFSQFLIIISSQTHLQ